MLEEKNTCVRKEKKAPVADRIMIPVYDPQKDLDKKVTKKSSYATFLFCSVLFEHFSEFLLGRKWLEHIPSLRLDITVYVISYQSIMLTVKRIGCICYLRVT